MSESSVPSERERKLDGILADYLEAQRTGHAPRRDAFLARYPEFAADLAAFLDDQAILAGIAPAAIAGTPDTVSVGDGAATAPPVKATPGMPLGCCGDYELLEEIARGGMGVVFKARQVSLNRLVALKMILSGQLASARDVERFRAEAEAAASLDHPHVLPIYEVGDCDGQQFFSMKLVEGGSLSTYLARTPRPPLRELVDVLAKVCRAVHFAHQRGILHRDLKPGNILLQTGNSESGSHKEGETPSSSSGRGSPSPFVTDFGLAKRVEGDSRLTQSGAVVGTPSYMPPEQAKGLKKLTTAVDVYALGAILYEILTGQPPFRGESPMETLLLVLEGDPPRPRSLNPQTDRDLETICRKCLEKEPQKRYGSAEALADDLQRWLDGLPILARPASSAERAVKWAKRRPAIAGLAAAVVCVAATGILGVVWKWQHAVAAERLAVIAKKAAQDRERDERKAREEEHQARLDEAAARREAETAQKKEIKARQAAEAAQKAEEKAKLAAQAAQKKEAKARADEEVARKATEAARVRTDGLRLAAEADAARFRDPGLALLLAIEGAQKAPSHLTYSALYGALGECRELFAVGDGGRDERGWHIYQGSVTQARVLPDGKRVLSLAGASLRVHDIATGKQLQEWPGYNLPLTSAVLDSEGKRVVLTGSGYAPVRHADGKVYNYTDRIAYVIDLASNKEVRRLRGAQSALASAEFSPDGTLILTASWDAAARLYDAATGKLLFTMKPPNNSPLRNVLGDKSLLLARFTPDGKHVLTVTTNDHRVSFGYDSDVALDREDKVPTDPDFDPQYRPLGPSGNGSGSLQANLDAESVVGHLWDATTGKQVTYYYKPPPGLLAFGHVWKPKAAVFSPNSELVAIAFDDVVSVWETKTGKRRFDLLGHEGAVPAIAFSPDGRLIATAGADKTVRLWEADTGREKLRLRGHTEGVTGGRFDRTGKLLASWSSDRTACVWDTSSGIQKAVVRGHVDAVNAADFSLDGKQLITAGDKTVRVWTLEQPRMPDTRLEGHKGKATAVCYSPDGKLAVTAAVDGTARLWDTVSGKLQRTFGEGRNLGEVRSAQFSPDGKRLVTAASLSTSVVGAKATLSAVLIWDVATGEELLALKELSTGALQAFFIDDGKKLLTVGDGYVRVKRIPEKPKEVTPDSKKDEVDINGLKFSIERGNSTDAGRVQLWDAETGKLLVDVRGTSRGWLSSNDQRIPAISKDGKRLVIFDHQARMPKVLDGATGKVVAELRGPWHWQKPTFQFSPDSRLVYFEHGGDIAVHDAGTGARVAKLSQFPRWDRQFALSGDGKRLAVAADKFGFVWDVEKRTLLSTLRGHENVITTIALNADGSQVLTGASDQTTGLWDARTGTMLALFKGHAGAVKQVAFRPDGKQVATVGEDGTARLWPTDLWSVVLPRRTRGFTDEERDRYELPAAPGTPGRRDPQPKFDPPAGTPVPEPFSLAKEPADPVAERKAADALAPLKAEVAKGAAPGLWQKVVEVRKTYPGTGAALEAARLLERLPGPLAALDPAKIPAAERVPSLAKDVVAVVGESGRRQWSAIDGIAVSPSGKVVATWARSYVNAVYLWDAETLAARGQISGGFLGFRDDRDELMVDNYESVGFWDASAAQPRQRATTALPGANGCQAVSPDGRFAVGFVNGEWQTVSLWDLKPKTPARRPLLNLPKKYYLASTVFSPDSSCVVLALNKEVYLYDLRGDAPKQRAVLAFPKESPQRLVFSPDGKYLAGPVGNAVPVWDLSAAEPRLVTEMKGLQGATDGIAFSPDGRSLWTTFWNQPSRQWNLATSPAQEMARLSGDGAVSRALAVSPGGKRLFTADGVTLRSWDAVGGTWKQRPLPHGHMHGIATLAFSPDDVMLFSADSGQHVRIWSLKNGSGQEQHYLPGVAHAILLTPDGRDLIAGRSAFTLWDVRGAAPRQRTQPVASQRLRMPEQALSGDGKRLARGGVEPAVTLFDLTGATPRLLASLPAIGERNNGVQSLTVSPDGRLLIAAADTRGVERGPVCAWRVSDKGLQPLTFPWLQATQVAFSPDGTTLAAARHGGVELWDLTAPVPQVRARLSQKEHEPCNFCYTLAGERIITWLGTRLTVLDAATAKEVQTWTWPGPIATVVPAHDGRHVAVGNTNGTIYILRIPAKSTTP
jgi:WD40 repeat protein/tRNA A-37 threonylcarbamoyl transferase component Bud32